MLALLFLSSIFTPGLAYSDFSWGLCHSPGNLTFLKITLSYQFRQEMRTRVLLFAPVNHARKVDSMEGYSKSKRMQLLYVTKCRGLSRSPCRSPKQKNIEKYLQTFRRKPALLRAGSGLELLETPRLSQISNVSFKLSRVQASRKKNRRNFQRYPLPP